MVRKFVFLSLVSVLLVALVLPACAAPEAKNVIKIGVLGPMQFMQGEHHWYGAQKAEKEINDAGGITINGEQYLIKVIKVDTNEIMDVPGAAAATERVITVDNADFLVGGFRTESVFGMQDVAMDYHKIFIICGASTIDLCKRVADDYDRYKYTFRGTPYNSYFLVSSDFLMLGMVGAILKQELNIGGNLKAAIIAEKLVWADPMVAIAEAKLPAMGIDVVGTWRPSDTATDVTAELTAIAEKEPHIIFTTFSGPVGITYAKQWGELEIPACSVGINVESQKSGFWEATGGKANHEMTLNTYARAKITDKTIPFYDAFVEETGEFPTYCAATYDAILNLVGHIEDAQTIDADALIPYMEKTDFISTSGRLTYYPNDSDCPQCPHDLVWGPGYLTGVGTQWQDGELKCVWPVDWEGVTYEGTVPYVIPQRVIDKFKVEKPIEEEAPPKEETPSEEPAADGLSFKAAEYANADYGFSIKYPDNWQEGASEGTAVFTAQAPAQVPALIIAIAEDATFADALTAGLEGTGAASNIKITSESETTLADGTPASEAVIKVTLKGYPADGLVIGVTKDDKWIIATIATVSMLAPYNEALFSEIAHTLQFE